MTLQERLALAREIARRTTPRFVDIPRTKRGTAFDAECAADPGMRERHAAAMKRKAREEREV